MNAPPPVRVCALCRVSCRDPSLEVCPRDGGPLRPWADDPLIGTVLADRYQLVAPLGMGGMGAVYLGERLPDELEVAVKVIREEHAENPRVRERFLREVRHLGGIRSPYVVKVFDSGWTEDGRGYLVMERAYGPTLTERLRGAPLTLVEAVRVGRDIARALAAAHATGLVHRDLKPDNIVLSPDGPTKVLDFGIAKALTDSPQMPAGRSADPSLTEAHRVVGTPAYMSPETITKEPLTASSDLYALGVILFEMIVGEVPFKESDVLRTMYGHLSKQPARVATVAPDRGAPEELDQLVDQLLKKKPEKRPKDARMVADRLEALLMVLEARREATGAVTTGAAMTEDDDPTTVSGDQGVWAFESTAGPGPEKTTGVPDRTGGGVSAALIVTAVLALLLGFALTAGTLLLFMR